MRTPWITLSIVLFWTMSPARAEPDQAETAYFESKVRPTLIAHCYRCHSSQAEKLKAGLRLDSRENLIKGGESGPAVVPGQPDKSRLIDAIRYTNKDLQMPPKSKLPQEAIADLTSWVKMGAPWPREAPSASASKPGYEKPDYPKLKREHWAWQPLGTTPAPPVKDAAWPRSEIDRYVLAKLEEKGLRPVVDAGRGVLIRRLYFDLVGLPPSPEAIDAFVEDRSVGALEKVVDQLLASPQFGERWGRYWLDVARYAESNGNADNTAFPEAWRYRNYVISAHNKDKPYARFIEEQIAGDLLPAGSPAERDELLIATGFLALTSKPRAQNNPDYAMDLVADQIDVTSRAVLGMTVLCARCHDHKFDPITTKEYYALAGIFGSTSMLFGEAKGKGGKGSSGGGFHELADGAQCMGVRDGKVENAKICVRGESQNRGETVSRGVLSIAGGTLPSLDSSKSGRLELSHWLTAPANPLTPRIAANRVWMHLFGEGIVRTPDNFGVLGGHPSHPELLDCLAISLVRDGWSLKRLIRKIVLSRTYGLSGAHDAACHEKDPGNVLLWRMNPRRLDAEALRDALLVVSGRLDPKPLEGSGVSGAGGKGKNKVESHETSHRSVYLAVLRGAPMSESMALFDVASPDLVVAQRDVTTVPTQALFMMNSSFVMDQARGLAERVLRRTDLDDPGRANEAYRWALGRSGLSHEKERAVRFVRERLKESGAREKNPREADLKAWTSFCHVLLETAEFRYVE
jgi:cytochrome c553